MIYTIVRCGSSANNLLKVDKDGSIFTVPTASKDEKLLMKLFSNATGSNMAINAAVGSSTNIWDGTGIGDTGTSDFTVSSSGTATETSASMKEGTNGLDVTLLDGDKVDFSGSTDMTSSSVLQFWIQPRSGWQNGTELQLELRDSAGRIGDKLEVINYMSDETLNTWKLVQVPLVDFNAGTIGTVTTVRLKAKGVDKVFYLDSLLHGVPSDSTIDPIYLLKPTFSEEFKINNLIISLTAPSTSATIRQSWDSINFANIAALSSGVLLLIETEDGASVISRSAVRSLDLLALSKSFYESIGPNYTTVNYIIDINPIILDGKIGDQMRIIIRDDLSALTALTVNGQGIIKEVLGHS